MLPERAGEQRKGRAGKPSSRLPRAKLNRPIRDAIAPWGGPSHVNAFSRRGEAFPPPPGRAGTHRREEAWGHGRRAAFLAASPAGGPASATRHAPRARGALSPELGDRDKREHDRRKDGEGNENFTQDATVHGDWGRGGRERRAAVGAASSKHPFRIRRRIRSLDLIEMSSPRRSSRSFGPLPPFGPAPLLRQRIRLLALLPTS